MFSSNTGQLQKQLIILYYTNYQQAWMVELTMITYTADQQAKPSTDRNTAFHWDQISKILES